MVLLFDEHGVGEVVVLPVTVWLELNRRPGFLVVVVDSTDQAHFTEWEGNGELEIVARNYDDWIVRGTDYVHDLGVLQAQHQMTCTVILAY